MDYARSNPRAGAKPDALPVPKAAGSHVVGGTMNRAGVLWVRVTAPRARFVRAVRVVWYGALGGRVVAVVMWCWVCVGGARVA